MDVLEVIRWTRFGDVVGLAAFPASLLCAPCARSAIPAVCSRALFPRSAPPSTYCPAPSPTALLTQLLAALFCMTPIALFFLIDISAFMYQSMKKQMGILTKATVPHVA